MNAKARYSGHFRPARQQELLLRAALLPSAGAVDAWRAWKESLDLDRLEPGVYRLLPQLFHNLQTQGVKEPPMDRLRSVYRHTWYKNQIALREMAGILRSFHSLGIPAMLLDDAALVLLCDDFALRPLVRFDILIPPERALEATETLQKRDWVPVLKAPETFIPIAPSIGFGDGAGRNITLHWRTLTMGRHAGLDRELWDAKVSASIDDVAAYTASPADQLLLTCAHAAEGHPWPAFSWLADALIIVFRSRVEVDWSRLSAQAEKHRLILPLRDMLSYLSTEWGANIPPSMRCTIWSAHISKTERLEHRARLSRQNPVGRLASLWFKYRRMAGGKGIQDRLVSIPKFIQHAWGK